MSTKALILSSSGLKNLVSGIENDEEFEFVFGQRRISMKNLYAEFISPVVSKLHQTDPTINHICFDDKFKDINLSENSISKFNLLSKGETVRINEEESFEMKIISIIIGNEELFKKLNELYSNEISEANIDHYLSKLTFLNQLSPLFKYFKYFHCGNIINEISSHFYSINKKKLKEVPKEIVYSILCNSNLQLENEDSLLDFVEDFLREEDKSEADNICFYETIEYSMLSENKFEEFIDTFETSNMTHCLWLKLKQCFYTNKRQQIKVNENRYRIKYPSKPCAIIDYLTKKVGGNVYDKGVVNVTASSTYYQKNYHAKNAVDVHIKNKLFCSKDLPNSWLKYDFIKRKVNPTGYLITTAHDIDSDHPRSWVIEGSNNDKDWVTLDTRHNDTNLTGCSTTCQFTIKPQEESYRYLQMRQTDKNSGYNDFFTFSSLDFIGILS